MSIGKRQFLVLSILCLWVGCSDRSADPDSGTNEHSLVQISGCRDTGITRAMDDGSCFAYQFDTALIVDFCVMGNCCPDSNRFDISSQIMSDTITVAVQDTAAHLCRCICTYTIHAEFPDLPLSSYMFACDLNGEVAYLERVAR